MGVSVEVGARVLTADGTDLGSVKEVVEGHFKVDVPRHFDFWLDDEIVAAASAAVVNLTVGDADIGAWKKDIPHEPGVYEGSLDPRLDPGTVGDYALLRGFDQGPPRSGPGP